MKIFRIIIALLIILLNVMPLTVSASDITNITVKATGIIVNPPGGFTAVYVNDSTVRLYWTIPAAADIVELRFSTDAFPVDRTDGTLLYTGNATSITHSNVYLDNAIVYYRIWTRRADTGLWEAVGSISKGDFMTQSTMLFVLLAYAALVIFMPIVVRVFFGNAATKTLYILTAVSAAFAIIIFMTDTSGSGGFVFSFASNWAKLWGLSIAGLIGNIIVVGIGTTIDKGGKTSTGFTYAKKDPRSASQISYDKYMNRNKPSGDNGRKKLNRV